jgi:N-acetylmuramoyl-L-alanine amidase
VKGWSNQPSWKWSDGGAKLSVALRQPANAYFRPEGDLGLALVIEVAPQVARQVRLIVVDAGHGGKDPGAMSPPRPGKPQLVEKHLTLDIAFRLKRLLEEAGYKVVMTRTEDVYVPLPDRVAIANNLRADAFVSVHLNSFPQPGAQWGTEVYFWTPQSYPLAESIYRNLLAIIGRKGNGIRQRQLYVVRHTIMPSVLVEPCYLNHPEEEELLRDENFREKIAYAICRGIMEFFGDLRTLERRGE